MSRRRTTKKQLKILINFLEENRELAYRPKQQDINSSERKWGEVRDILNKEVGPTKTTEEWKNVFNDLKTNVKRKARLIKLKQVGTGGGPSKNKPLADLEQRVLRLIKPVVIEGLPEIGEPGIVDGNLNIDEAEAEYFIKVEPTVIFEDTTGLYEVVDDVSVASTSASAAPCAKRRKQRRRPYRPPIPYMRELIRSNNNIARAVNNIAKALLIIGEKWNK